MGISHCVYVARPRLVELLIAVEGPSTAIVTEDESWPELHALIDSLFELDGTEDQIDMWFLGIDVGEVLNVPLGCRDVFWALGSSIHEMAYIEPSQVAEFASRLGTECEPARWYDAALASGTRLQHPARRHDTEQIVGEAVALIHRATALGAGFIVWLSA